MDLFSNAIKGQFNTLNFLLLLLVISYLLLRKKRTTASRFMFGFCLFFFVVCSTGYLPGYLINKMENHYPPFVESGYAVGNDTVYVHALGGGYTADKRLQANGQLSASSLGRLTEAIRVARLYDKSVLVLSGPIASGEESLASVERRAALQLGFDPERIIVLETPVTTQQEAKAFASSIGKEVDLILVTDAVHMKRAMRFFENEHLHPIAAPTNYLIKIDNNPISLKWMPSVENMLMMDRIFREWLGSIKGYILGALYFPPLCPFANLL